MGLFLNRVLGRNKANLVLEMSTAYITCPTLYVDKHINDTIMHDVINILALANIWFTMYIFLVYYVHIMYILCIIIVNQILAKYLL